MKSTFIDPLNFKVIFLNRWFLTFPLGVLSFGWVFFGFSLFETKPDGLFFLWGFAIFAGCICIYIPVHMIRSIIPPRMMLILLGITLLAGFLSLGYFALYSQGVPIQAMMTFTMWWCICYFMETIKHNKLPKLFR